MRKIIEFGFQKGMFDRNPLQKLLENFNGGDEVALTCGVSGTEVSYIISQHIGNRLYWWTRLRTTNIGAGGPWLQVYDSRVVELFLGYSNGTTPAITKSGFTWSANANLLGGGYFQSTNTDHYLQISTHANCTMAGALVYAGLTGAAMCLVAIDGDNTLADLLPTAQQLVDGGSLAATALVGGGGTLNPTDRILDCYNLTSDILPPGAGKMVVFSRSLSAGAHTVRVTTTAYRNSSATGGVFTGICLLMASGPNAAGMSTSTTLIWLFITKQSTVSVLQPVWEISWNTQPTGATGHEWVGHSGSLLIKTAPVVKLNGSTITPTHLSQYVGSEIQIVTQNNVRHSETGATNIGVLDLTYTYNRYTGLTIAHSLAWATTGVSNGYPCMFNVAHASFDRFNCLGSGVVGGDLTDNDDAVNFNSRGQAAYAWDSDGYQAGVLSIPNLTYTVEDWVHSGNNQLWWADVAAAGGTWKKAYTTRFGSDEAFDETTVWSALFNYRVAWITAGANGVFAALK